MTLATRSKQLWYAALLGVTLAMTGCGGGIGADSSEKASAPAADASQYQDLIFYCNATEPTGDAATQDGWTTEFPTIRDGNTTFSGSALVSAAGSSHEWDSPLHLVVPLIDYRAATGAVVTSRYGKPEWRMGVAMSTVLSSKSVGCITQTARVYTPPAINLGNGYPTIPQQPPSLVWVSFWNQQVPVSQLPGYKVNGFEFVSNFTPRSGQVFFVVDKAGFSQPQAFSICHLAPQAAQWHCVQPTISDAGQNWQVTTAGPVRGVYVLVSPTLQ